MFIMLANCVLFYIISGILFWATDYFTDVLKVEKNEVTVAFGVTSITGPVLGAISSVPLEKKIGFTTDKTLPVCLGVAVVCYAVGFFIPFYDDFIPVIIHIWFLLFFGGMMLPILNGRLLAIVMKKHLAHSQSLCYMSYNLLGWLPSPFIYGWICE